MASSLATISSNRIGRKFERLRAEKRKALVCYVTAGHPDFERSLDLMRGLEQEGVDVMEVGVPFSDPIADGPVIQQSSQQALALGMSLERTLDLIERARLEIPVVLFTYLNPLLASGPDVLTRARDAGVDGILLTDLPVGADPAREHWLGSSDLAYIRLVAPTTPVERMREIARNGSGFVYLISRLGVTGARTDVPPELPETAARLRSATDLPICIGFGVSGPEQARTVAGIADGVIVGSALVKAAGESIDRALELTRTLRHALDN
ncbi:MAG: tryptophan synthase subunit alpha [Gemmatimonadaceae bacterium]|nr:tryptophan synthase subunit alpha [Gemmatimonadaceae bacterium]